MIPFQLEIFDDRLLNREELIAVLKNTPDTEVQEQHQILDNRNNVSKKRIR